MNFRRRLTAQEPIAFQLAPIIDVVMFLLCFFLLTWNLARYEYDLDIKLPTARQAKEPKQLPGEIVLNIHQDGNISLNHRILTSPELEEILRGIVKISPDQSVVLRADEATSYKDVVKVLDVCRRADLWNIAFATARPDQTLP
jgi:biopolymer transport protein ExbD